LRIFLIGLLLVLAGLGCAITPFTARPMFTAPPITTDWSGAASSGEAPILIQPTATPQSLTGDTKTDPKPSPTPLPTEEQGPPFLYHAQAGDTLHLIAIRYGVDPSEISLPGLKDLPPENKLLDPGQLLIIPDRLPETTDSQQLMPDSEIVYSPSAADFDALAFAEQAGGWLGHHDEYLMSTGLTRGGDVVARVAIENSINPRILLALMEYETGSIYGTPSETDKDYPMGVVNGLYKGLYRQLAWAVNQLSIGYYGWREGRLTEIHLSDGKVARLAPDLNAGTAALQYYFAQRYDSAGWAKALDPQNGFPALYERMFGDPWIRAQTVEPLYPPDLVQPPLILPFKVNQPWAFTGGPHGAWERDGAWAAIDFAPGSLTPGCVKSDTFVLASAAGLIVRSENGVVAIDLDGDGREQTGWVLVYLHVAKNGRIAKGEWVDVGDPIGHPSCEGGFSTGTHVHFARKYNGEWIVADGPLPFTLSGWTVHSGGAPYQGTLTRDGETITASPLGPSTSRIIRRANDP
jgi:murein DD-endopeptidase MepM/ murein hydrolase activator NlpD